MDRWDDAERRHTEAKPSSRAHRWLFKYYTYALHRLYHNAVQIALAAEEKPVPHHIAYAEHFAKESAKFGDDVITRTKIMESTDCVHCGAKLDNSNDMLLHVIDHMNAYFSVRGMPTMGDDLMGALRRMLNTEDIFLEVIKNAKT